MQNNQKECITRFCDSDGKEFIYKLLNGSKGWLVELTAKNETNQVQQQVVASGCTKNEALDCLLFAVSDAFKLGLTSFSSNLSLTFPCEEKAICQRMASPSRKSYSGLQDCISNDKFGMQVSHNKPKIIIILKRSGLGLSILSVSGEPQEIPPKLIVSLSQFYEKLSFERLVFAGYLISDEKLEICDLLYHDHSFLEQSLRERATELDTYNPYLPAGISITSTYFLNDSKEKAAEQIIALGYNLYFLPVAGGFTKTWNENIIVITNENVTKLQIMGTLPKAGMINLGAIVNEKVVVIAQVASDEVKDLDMLDVVEVSFGSIGDKGMVVNAHIIKKTGTHTLQRLEPMLARSLGYELTPIVAPKPLEIDDGFFWDER